MSTGAVRGLWLLCAGLVLVTVIVGAIAGYRADDASVVPGGEVALAVPQWRTAWWALVGASVLAGAIALAATVHRAVAEGFRRGVAPVALVLAGIVGAFAFLPLLVLSAGGLAWLVARAARARVNPSTAGPPSRDAQ